MLSNFGLRKQRCRDSRNELSEDVEGLVMLMGDVVRYMKNGVRSVDVA